MRKMIIKMYAETMLNNHAGTYSKEISSAACVFHIPTSHIHILNVDSSAENLDKYDIGILISKQFDVPTDLEFKLVF